MKTVNIMNFARSFEPRDLETEKLLAKTTFDQLNLVNEMGLPATFLLQYDVIANEEFVKGIKERAGENIELGFWYEVVEPLTTACGMPYNSKRGWKWDWFINPGFSVAYPVKEREILIDEAMRKFKEVFGYYPRTVGSWLLDTYTVKYLCEHYEIDALCYCRDQVNTDAYTFVGGYFNQAYYPSKNHVFTPASSEQAQINTPVFRLLGSDPIYNYDNGKYASEGCKHGPYTMELVHDRTSGRNPKIVDWYLDSYFRNESLGFAYMQIGQENSFASYDIISPLRMQIEKVQALGDVKIEKMCDTGKAFKEKYSSTPPTSVAALKNWDSPDLQSVYYDCKNYTANIMRKDDKVFIRSLFLFDDRIEDIYNTRVCDTFDSVYENLPIIDTYYQRGDSDGGLGLILDESATSFDAAKSGDGELDVFWNNKSVTFRENDIIIKNCTLSFTYSMVNTKITVNSDYIDYEYNLHNYRLNVQGGEITHKDGTITIKGDVIILTPQKFKGARMIQNKHNFLGIAESKYSGAPHEYVLITEKHQLLDKKTWDKFVEVFTEDSDDHDVGWRCEYWGKMMRGACLTYRYHGTDELYSMLEYAVRELLKVQREDGRFSTYSETMQFNGWDLWGRKYVLTGMMHFIDICKDEYLKADILKAISRHADYIVERIGSGKGQKSILETSNHWLCLNSCTILEPFIDLYKRTGKKSYLDFAEYIIKLGGCSGGNLIDLAILDELAPYEYPVNKAYEMMSFFEGVLAYYEITGEEKYLDAVVKFVEKINETDVTLIGCSGCTHELFDHSIVKQTEYSDVQMQETCVTVTWMRVLTRLHLLTGNVKYIDRIERSAYNALYGSINTKNEKGFSIEDGEFLDPVIFDSYSPLYNNRRGFVTGGFKRFRTGGFYGCCACIGSAGTGIFPLIGVLRSDEGLVINEAFEGVVTTKTPLGNPITLNSVTDYPVGEKYALAVFLDKNEFFEIKIRIPDWCDEATVTVGDEIKKVSSGYYSIKREWSDGDTVEIIFPLYLTSHHLNGKTAYTYGPLVLARDEMKEGKKTDSEFFPTEHNAYRMAAPEEGEMLRIMLECEGDDVLLTDYASTGKYWTDKNAKVSVWLNAK